MKPRIFIGSSKEQLELAYAIQENLHREFETKVWDQDVFEPSQYPLESLGRELDKSDFGIFVFAPDDLVMIRGEEQLVPRDNVIFELGMFTGKLGRDRTFVVTPMGINNLRLPIDLSGLSCAEYDPSRTDKNMTAALGPACNKIRKLIRKRSEVNPRRAYGLERAILFSELTSSFEHLISSAQEITLFFIHSRRWRENHNDQLQAFLQKPSAKLNVFLPNLGNAHLMQSLKEHFDDGPYIPGFIADAYRYFSKLSEEYTGKVLIHLFNIYPTYTFYRFDDKIIVAMYPTTTMRRSVPTFELDMNGILGDFFRQDIEQIIKEITECSENELRNLAEMYSNLQE